MKLAWVLLLISLALLVAAVLGVSSLWTGALGSIGLLAAATTAAVSHDIREQDPDIGFDGLTDR